MSAPERVASWRLQRNFGPRACWLAVAAVVVGSTIPGSMASGQEVATVPGTPQELYLPSPVLSLQTMPTTAPTTMGSPDTEPYMPQPMTNPGYEGRSSIRGGGGAGGVGAPPREVRGDDHTLPIPDRWRVGIPGDYVQNRISGGWFDPYNQNVLKGDYPVFGNDWFMIVTATSDTLFEARSINVPSGVSTTDPDSFGFFGNSDQFFIQQNFILSLELFQGNTVYKPRDLEFKLTMVQNFNYVAVGEQNLLNPSPRDGENRYDEHFALQEAFVDKHIQDLSVNYDFWAIRAGIQLFNADFRGFLFNDNNLGIRLLGNYDNAKLSYNIAWFHQLEKDTNSGLNTFDQRGQDVFFANVYREDFIWKGYTAQLLFAMNLDYGDIEYDQNDFIVRPQPIGTVKEKTDEVYYLGWAGDGHIGPVNITHQFYQALGNESFNGIADQHTRINAQFFAIEASVDDDWKRYKTSFAYVSGDDDPTDDEAKGFDAIFDNPNFAGGQFSYFVRQATPLTGGGTGLVGRNSFYPSLRTSKEQGQANFVNPGLFIYNIGMDLDVTPRTKMFLNANYLQFADPSVLNLLLTDEDIDRDIGYDLSIGIQYRPFNNQNVIFTGGAAALIPADGFEDIYTNRTLYSTFLSVTLTY